MAQFFPSSLTIVAQFFPYFFLDIKFKICTLCWGGGGMIGGGECRIKYVLWMYGLVRFCVVCCEYCYNQHRVLSLIPLDPHHSFSSSGVPLNKES